jgi:hypothetical protein
MPRTVRRTRNAVKRWNAIIKHLTMLDIVGVGFHWSTGEVEEPPVLSEEHILGLLLLLQGKPTTV